MKGKITAGKIISVVGAPGCGKSFLVNKLATYYKGIAILEGEETDLPKQIIRDLKYRDKNYEVFLWWRNKLAGEMLYAQKIKNSGKIVITDNFWMNNETYIDYFFQGFEKKVMKRISLIDRKLLLWPDAVIVLSTSLEHTRDIIKTRKRSFENLEKYITMVKSVDLQHKKLFKNNPRAIFINRTNMDFNKKSDLNRIIKKINELLSSSSK